MEHHQSKRKSPLKTHDFVAALVKDETKPPKTRIISGYVGKSNKPDYTRIYLDIELRRYVDFSTEEILHAEDFRDAKSRLANVMVWVRETARITHHGNWIASEDPTTMATGEEGGGDPTTMATGEETNRPPNPMELVINPFGQFQ